MAYRLQRTDGNLIRSFKLMEHNKPTCEAELWYYGFTDDRPQREFVVWYKFEGKWEILIAGTEAYARYGV